MDFCLPIYVLFCDSSVTFALFPDTGLWCSGIMASQDVRFGYIDEKSLNFSPATKPFIYY